MAAGYKKAVVTGKSLKNGRDRNSGRRTKGKAAGDTLSPAVHLCIRVAHI
jgi:hypothetical protein